MKAIYALAIAAAVGGMIYLNTTETVNTEADFGAFVAEFRKSYFNKEQYNYRLGVFQANMAKNAEMNANPNDDAVYGVTQFSDWTQEEFSGLLTLTVPAHLPETDIIYRDVEPVRGESFDWRDKNVMTPVKDQGSCGSCWSFAANEAHESAWALKTGQIVDLSEQELVDCSTRYGNHGCNGGWYFYAWDYVKAKGGLALEKDYPYAAKDQTCKTVSKRNAPITGYSKVSKSDASVKTAIKAEPEAVAVDASNWSQYRSGVFSNCSKRINHAVVAVGFTDDYWVIRNSWGKRWGESGFMKIKMGDTCGIEQYVYKVNV